MFLIFKYKKLPLKEVAISDIMVIVAKERGKVVRPIKDEEKSIIGTTYGNINI